MHIARTDMHTAIMDTHTRNQDGELRKTCLLPKVYFISDTNDKINEDNVVSMDGFGTVKNVYAYDDTESIKHTLGMVLDDVESVYTYDSPMLNIEGEKLWDDKIWYAILRGQSRAEVLTAIKKMCSLNKQKCQVRRAVWKEYQKEKEQHTT